MTLTALLSRPCTIISREAVGDIDDYGNEVPEESSVDTVCELQQIQRDEPAGEGEFSDTRWVAIFPAGTELKTSDAVLIDGKTYELEGDPWAVRNPRLGTESHVEATLCRTAGASD